MFPFVSEEYEKNFENHWANQMLSSIQSKQAPIGGPLLFSTALRIRQASMHLCSVKKRTGDKVSRQDFLFKLATELRKHYIVKRSSRNVTIARPYSLSTTPKKIEAERRKQCQKLQTALKTKPANIVSSPKKLYLSSVFPRSFPNALYVRQRKYETFFKVVFSFCPSFQIKLSFVNRLIELRDLSICSTLKLQPQYAYKSKNTFS